jgi:hypothetical protein
MTWRNGGVELGGVAAVVGLAEQGEDPVDLRPGPAAPGLAGLVGVPGTGGNAHPVVAERDGVEQPVEAVSTATGQWRRRSAPTCMAQAGVSNTRGRAAKAASIWA